LGASDEKRAKHITGENWPHPKTTVETGIKEEAAS
jgi:hypothetical protein